MVRENRPVTAVGGKCLTHPYTHNTQPPCQHPLCSSCACVFTMFPSGPLSTLSGMSSSDLHKLLCGEVIKGWQPASTWEMWLRVFDAEVAVQRWWGRATMSLINLWFFPKPLPLPWAEVLQ